MAGESANNATVLNLFKKVYGDKVHKLIPDGFPILELIQFDESAKVGESYSETVMLSYENGFTLGGSTAEIFDIGPARAGAVKQCTITPSVSVLSSVIPWSVISRAAQGNNEKAFAKATKTVVESNLKSHHALLATLAYYGQADALLGYVSYATATYRGVSFTNGSATLNGVVFTNGVNTTTKQILLAPGQFAAGIWIGREGSVIHQVNSSGVIVGTGTLQRVNAKYGYITVSFTPVAASSTTSHRLCFENQEGAKDMVGANKILKNTGSLFGINAAQHGLWAGNVLSAGNKLLGFAKLQEAAADAVNNGGLDGDVRVKVNPRTFAKMVNIEAARRSYDDSYGPIKYENGAREIEFWYSGGKMSVEGDRFVKEGEAYGFKEEDWVRSGSAEIAFKIPGIEKEIIFPLENVAGHMFRTFADQYVLCRGPARQFLVEDINDESTDVAT